MRLPPFPAAPLLLLLAAACGGDASSGALATRADSAGVQIVTSAEPSWRSGDGWRIEPTPTLDIGPTVDDDPNYDLFQVRGARLLPGGDLVVLVAGHRQLRIFDSQGAWVRTIGRDGDGPGELRSAGGLQVAGDTIFVADNQLSRITAFSTTGEALTSWPYPTTEANGRLFPGDRMADGSWLGWAGLRFDASGSIPGGTTRNPVLYFRIPADLAQAPESILTTPGTEQSIKVSNGEGGAITGISVWTPPLGRGAPVTAVTGRLIWGDNTFPEVRVHGMDGAPQMLLRWGAPAIPVDAALIERIKAAALLRAGEDPRARERVESQYSIPSPAPEVPYFSAINLDVEGNFWVREYQVIPSDSVRFQVFHADGQWLGSLALAARHTVQQFASDRLVTTWQDADDIEHVRVYRIVK
ncbi:MAG: 6-bladed beta-propeller [Gemmatimonadota bacterium]|nr:6-bladed beta-propeller [Gemmatimonadota bacterium]